MDVFWRSLNFLALMTLLAGHPSASLHCHKDHDHASDDDDVLLEATTTATTSEVKVHLNDPSRLVPQRLVQFSYGGDSGELRGADLFDHPRQLPRQETKPGRLPKDSLDSKDEDDSKKIVSFCPDKCGCGFTNGTNQLEVVCQGHFEDDFPLEKLREDIEILRIQPTTTTCHITQNCRIVENHLTLGPIYKHLRLLKVLVIVHSNVPNIGRRTMWGLSGLKVLNLSHNKLTNLVEQNFEGLYSLTNLMLDGNQIKSMVSASFRHIPQLEVLSLRDNQIEELAPRIFYKLRNLKSLDLSGNHLQHISGAIFADIPNLEVLRCQSCDLFQLLLPDNTYLRKLLTLDLANNSVHDFRDLQSSLFNNLQHLDLSQNQLSGISAETFWDSRRLNVLKLSHNNLTVIDNCALCNTSLIELDLNHNSMSTINLNLFDWNTRSMKKLGMAGNWVILEEIEALLQKLPNLEDVNLASAHLVSLGSTLFASNSRLRSINVSDNYLVAVDVGAFKHISALEVLDLSSNYFMELTKEFFSAMKRLPRLRMIYLQNNRFACDRCHILPLKEWLDSSLKYWGACFPSSNPLCLKCSTPNEYMHLPIEELKVEDLPECIQDANLPPSGPAGFPGFIGQMDPDHRQNYPHFRFGGNGIDVSNYSLVEWMEASFNPFLAGGIAAVLALVVMLVLLTKYRHYGSYLTHEEHRLFQGDREDEDNLDILRNPVIALDKNSESYVNLRYPTLSSQDFSMNKS